MSEFNISHPSRQELRGFLVILLFEAGKWARNLWPFLVVILFQKKLFSFNMGSFFVIAAVTILIVLHAIFYYLHFYFHVESDQFVLTKGYIKRSSLIIPLERIQTVNSKQNILQKLFDVYTLEIDTAGSAKKEMKIYSVNKNQLLALNHALDNRKVKIEVDEKVEEKVEKQDDIVLRLSIKDLLKIGVSQNHIRSGLIIAALIFNFFNQVADVFVEQSEWLTLSISENIGSSGLVLWSIIIVFFILVSFTTSLVITLIKYYGLKLIKKEGIYEINSGLITNRNVLVPLSKVQQMNWSTNPFQQLFGIYKVRFKQAVSAKTKFSLVIDIPGAKELQLEQIQSEVFVDEQLENCQKIYSDPRYFRVKWLLLGWVPVIVPAYFYGQYSWLSFLAFAWLVLSYFYSKLIVQKQYVQSSKNQLIVGSGGVGTLWERFELFTAQSDQYKQSFLQKRMGLASIKIFNASGSMTIPYVDESAANRLVNYLIYKAELSNDPWM